MVDLQATPDATQKRSLFVAAEIVPRALMNERADLAEVGGELLIEVFRSVSTAEFGQVLCVLGDDGGHLRDRDDMVDQSCADGTLEHAVVRGGLRRLRRVSPPCSLMARRPTVPSWPAPEKRIPTACSPWSSASE